MDMATTTHKEPAMNLYEISHFDYAVGRRVVSGFISGTDIYAAKYGFWANLGDRGCLGARPSGRNVLHIIGDHRYTFTKIGKVAA
jgi:hypothetical protein